MPRLHKQRGFTLIELMVVLALGAMLMLTVTNLFITSLSGRAKTNIRKELKSEGALAMNQLIFLLRNAQPLSVCDGSPTDYLELTLNDGETTILTTAAETTIRIASNSAYLTSESVSVTNSLSFTCDSASDGNGQYVTIEFTLTKAGGSGNTSVSENFKSGVQIRNSTNN